VPEPFEEAQTDDFGSDGDGSGSGRTLIVVPPFQARYSSIRCLSAAT
jgi:hypothetical protein